MDLSGQHQSNLLPFEGTVHYFGPIMGGAAADKYLELLLTNIKWRNDEIILFGKRILTKRKVAWHGDSAYEYSYSNTQKRALPWTHELAELKSLVEQKCGDTFNSCLMNLYHNGREGVAWHSDGEKDLKKDGAIGSLSLGAERKFAFKNKRNKMKIEIFLEHGSLMVMKGSTQTHWLHCLPPATRVTEPRVNLTFRTILQ
jgi:alkylated DNA repair dioxygenase AlkB